MSIHDNSLLKKKPHIIIINSTFASAKVGVNGS